MGISSTYVPNMFCMNQSGNYNHNNNHQPQKNCQTLEHENKVLKDKNKKLEAENTQLIELLADKEKWFSLARCVSVNVAIVGSIAVILVIARRW
jgi:hypothetical protein